MPVSRHPHHRPRSGQQRSRAASTVTALCSRCGLVHPRHQPCPVLDTEAPLTANTVLAGHYRIRSVLHRGGMSMVYRAKDTRCPSLPVAIKELRVEPGATAEERRQAEAWFARESYVLSTLRHPLIPEFYAVFHERDHSYIAEEYIQGQTLDDLVRLRGPVAEHQAVAWGMQLCDLLAALHEQPDMPLIYRDLKPANAIRRESDGKLVLVDFGIARPMRPGEVGTTIGTPGYAPPEQYQGLASPQSDIYALGATLHRLLTGYDPEAGAPFSFPPVRDLNPAISPKLAAVVERAVRLDPAARYDSARQMRRALEAALWPPPVTPPDRPATVAPSVKAAGASGPLPVPAVPAAVATWRPGSITAAAFVACGVLFSLILCCWGATMLLG